MKLHRIDERLEYPHGTVEQALRKAWNEFFNIAKNGNDLAHWVILPWHEVVYLSSLSSVTDHSDPDLEIPDRIKIEIRGVWKLVKANSESLTDLLFADVRHWVDNGIVEAFRTPGIAKRFKRFGAKSFAIASSACDDYGIGKDAMSILWSNDKALTVENIRARQRSAQKPRRRIKKAALRKRRSR